MSGQWPHLSNAPIVEAVIEFQFSVSDNVTFDMLQEVANSLKEEYPEQEEKRSSIFKAVMTDSGPETEIYDQVKVGVSAKSSDGLKIVQLLRDRFSFSHLPPYQNWEMLEQDAFDVWRVFMDKTNIDGINRIGVRFINKIELDLPIDDFNNYIVGAPSIPDGLPQSLGAFDIRLVIPNQKIEADAILNMSMNGPDTGKNVVPIILDIDIGKIGHFQLDEQILHNLLIGMRNYKNEIFYRNVTDRVVRKYQ